jgi:predicted nucleic acid-binding protein
MTDSRGSLCEPNGTAYFARHNVIVSVLLFSESVPGQAFARSLGQGTVLVSKSLVEELNDVLGRDKLKRYVTRTKRNRLFRGAKSDNLFRDSVRLLQFEPAAF